MWRLITFGLCKHQSFGFFSSILTLGFKGNVGHTHKHNNFHILFLLFGLDVVTSPKGSVCFFFSSKTLPGRCHRVYGSFYSLQWSIFRIVIYPWISTLLQNDKGLAHPTKIKWSQKPTGGCPASGVVKRACPRGICENIYSFLIIIIIVIIIIIIYYFKGAK